MFENMLQNFRYYVVRASKETFEFSIVDFHLMNLKDLEEAMWYRAGSEPSDFESTLYLKL